MEWRDQGVLLSARRHGETSVIIDVFTQEHGRHSGVVRGGVSRKVAPILQPGSQLDLVWRARLEDQLGSYQVEPIRSRTVAAFSGRLALAGLNAVTSLVNFGLPEREAYPTLYKQTEQLMDLLGHDTIWPLAYLNWEMALLEELGFGLDLSCCAVTGATEELVFVSPKSGRAVSKSGAGEWADRMLPLPPCLRGEGDAPDDEIALALNTTGFFLENRLAPALGHKPLPTTRARFIETFTRQL